MTAISAAATESDRLLGSNGGSSTTSNHQGRWKIACVSFLVGIAIAVAGVMIVTRVILHESSSSHHATQKEEQTGSTSNQIQVQPITGDDVLNLEDEDRYTATQFISFTINTLGGIEDRGECDGRSVDATTGLCYLGNQENITEDVMHRIDIVEEVLNDIKNDRFKESPEIDRSIDVLKIFMMPEFFLRGPDGAFSTREFLEDGILIKAGDRIRDIVADDAFEDYLFVFGTVIAARSLDEGVLPWEPGTTAKDILYYNFAPVFRGGRDRKFYSVVTKKFISDEDFLRRTTLPEPTSVGVHNYADLTDALKNQFENRGVEIVQDNVIVVDGIRIGLEICLDHRMGSLWNSLKRKHHKQLVDVQLIVSAGMSIERGPNPIVTGGVVYLSDGLASSAACRRSDSGEFDSDNVCREEVAGLKHLPNGGPGYSDFFPLAACIDLEANELLKGYYSMYQTQGCAYTLKLYGIDVYDEYEYYPPSIEVYPTVALPGTMNGDIKSSQGSSEPVH